jgi:hypothetical protein
MAAAKEQMKLKFRLACEAALKVHDMLFELNHLLFDEELEEQSDHLEAIQDANRPITYMMMRWADYLDSVDELVDESDEI